MRTRPFLLLVLFLVAAGPAYAQFVSRDQIVDYTAEWTGERYADGRPKVPDDIVERMKIVSIEEAWAVLRRHGYHNQFEGNWEMIHLDVPIVGRALTAQYWPNRPELQKRMLDRGHGQGEQGPMNSWPIDRLQMGDVYVADAFGKIEDGTLIGDNLGNAIFAKSGNGVVFNASSRDLQGLERIEGFNAFVRAWHPSFLQEVMLGGINVPIRIGNALVLPGDIVLAKREGVIFIPAQFAEEIVETAEIVMLRDTFGIQRLRDGVYTPGQIDSEWTPAIRDDFFEWLEENVDTLPVPESRIRQILTDRNW
ncbi:MAG: hypothetical protein WED81_02380 [Rhodothermales bacterium]